MLRACMLCCLAAPVCADTVFLINGTAIDGVIEGRHEATIELRIGDIGRIFIGLEEIESIEKNNRDGTLQASSLSLEKRREEVVGNAEGVPEATAPAEPAQAEKKETGAAEEVVAPEGEKRYLTKDDADPETRAKVEDLVHELTRQKRRSRVRAERQLAEVGEPAVPFLLDVVAHENHLVRSAVLRIFRKAGNDAAIKATIDRLEDENTYVRLEAGETLRALTGKSFGYDANHPLARRRRAVAAWRKWYDERAAAAAAEKEAAGTEPPTEEPAEGSAQ